MIERRGFIAGLLAFLAVPLAKPKACHTGTLYCAEDGRYMYGWCAKPMRVGDTFTFGNDPGRQYVVTSVYP